MELHHIQSKEVDLPRHFVVGSVDKHTYLDHFEAGFFDVSALEAPASCMARAGWVKDEAGIGDAQVFQLVQLVHVGDATHFYVHTVLLRGYSKSKQSLKKGGAPGSLRSTWLRYPALPTAMWQYRHRYRPRQKEGGPAA